MDEKLFKQLLNELIHAQAEALGALTAAISRCTNAEQLSNELNAQIKIMKAAPGWSPTTGRLLQSAQAAAEAEKLLDRKKAAH